MNIHVSYDTPMIVAFVGGRFDVHSVEQFAEGVVDHISAENPHVIVDLSEVDFMDSSALAALVKALKRTIVNNGSIALVNISEAARIILQLTRLDQIFPQLDSVAAAQRQLTFAA